MKVAALVHMFLCVGLAWGAGSPYYIGAGRYDITGPAAEVNMMGYAQPTQTTRGIHFRQWARTFIFADSQKDSRVAFVNADICMGTQVMKMQVVDKLKAIYGELYTSENVLISGTHTHSGPAGFFQYVLFEVTSLGFVKESLDAIVDGIVESIKRAHESLQPGGLYINSGQLLNASINRSPTAYLRNPADERKKYSYDTDKEMVMLKMVDSQGKGIGMLDWFAGHCTSMNNTNRLISGDNKGHASFLMEQYMNGNDTLPGQGKFVAAFAQSNEGDVSPNTKGPHCLNSGKVCDILHSTCDGKNELCVAAGPGVDMFDSTRIIGEKQFNLGRTIYENATRQLSGPVEFLHTFVDFSNVTLTVNGTEVHTCPPAMGYSFAAGTIDGPGAFDFTQGDTTGNLFWNLVRDLIKTPSKAQIKCHAPKPILLDTGEITFPYPWQPKILPLQLLRVGQLVIIGVPAEFTTMSGRRLRDAVKKVLVENGKDRGFTNDTVMVIAGLSNTYSDYVATYEEYQEQRYEAASTVYGPHTLSAYIQEFSNLALALATGKSVPSGPPAPDYLSKQLSFLPPVIYDGVPSGRHYGDVHKDVASQYTVNQTAIVEFWAGNPRNNLMTGKTFLTVERKNSSGGWTVVQTDGSWDTRFHWEHTNELLGESLATVWWVIAPGTIPGTYRIQHFGYHKSVFGDISPYSGTSSEFKVVAAT